MSKRQGRATVLVVPRGRRGPARSPRPPRPSQRHTRFSWGAVLIDGTNGKRGPRSARRQTLGPLIRRFLWGKGTNSRTERPDEQQFAGSRQQPASHHTTETNHLDQPGLPDVAGVNKITPESAPMTESFTRTNPQAERSRPQGRMRSFPRPYPGMTDQSANEGDSGRKVSPSIVSQAALFVGAFLLYALLPTRNFNYADDSLRWAYELTQAGNLINSHHLFLNAMRWLYQLLHNAGLGISPVTLLALYSAFWGAVGLAVLYRLLVRARLGNLALWGTLVCAFSAGYWSYAIVGDVYVPAIALMIVGLDFVYSGITSQDARKASLYAIGATIAFLLMLAHHQAHIMFVLGLLPAAFLMQKAVVRKRRVLFGLGVPAAVCALALALYAGAYSSRPAEEQQGFLRFGAGYAESFDARPDQKQLGPSSVINIAAGETRALVSTNVMFRSPKVAQAIQSRYPYRAVYPFPYLVRGLPIPIAAIAGISALLAALSALYLFVRGLWAGLKEKGLVTLVFVPMIPQVVFFAWWEGISDEFALWTLPLIAIIVARGAAETRHPVRWLRTLVACVFFSTLVGSTFLYWNPDNDIDLVNDEYTKSLGKNDFLVGFEDIQSYHRISLEAESQGFEYFNIQSSAPHWSEADDARFEAALDSAVKRGAKISCLT